MESNLSQVKREILNATLSKTHPLYGSMLYWSQKSSLICDILIKNLSKKGEVVFDPFMGSGVTVLEAVSDRFQRNGIGCEINIPPIMLVETILKNRDLDLSVSLLNEFKNDLSCFNEVYEIICPKCKEKAIANSTIFDISDGKFVIKKVKTSCKCGCKEISSESLDSDFLSKMTTSFTLKKVKNLELLSNTKIAVYEGEHISNKFTPRNLHVLDQILELRDGKYAEIYDLINYILLGTLHLCKITDSHSNSQWPLWLPKRDCVEKNVVSVMNRKINSIFTMIDYVSKNYKSLNKQKHSFKVVNMPVQDLTDEIANNSVDLVITDPPYLGQVLYSEYMQLYKPFIDFDINYKGEIIVSSGQGRNKSVDNYFKLLEEAFCKISDKLKSNKLLCMYFHDNNLKVWDRLITLMSKSNLRYVTQVHINKTKTLKNILSPKKSLTGDALLFFIKDLNEGSYLKQDTKLSIEEIEINILEEAKIIIKSLGRSVSSTELYDNGLMEILIQNNWLSKLSTKYSSLIEIFENGLCWDKSTCTWSIQE